MTTIVSWKEIQDTEFDNLLLGNGFSMNVGVVDQFSLRGD